MVTTRSSLLHILMIISPLIIRSIPLIYATLSKDLENASIPPKCGISDAESMGIPTIDPITTPLPSEFLDALEELLRLILEAIAATTAQTSPKSGDSDKST